MIVITSSSHTGLVMFPKYFSPCPLPPSSLSSPPPPLLWSCLNTSSAAAELLQLARKSKERCEQQEMLAQSPPSPSPPPRSPPSISSGYKPLLKFSVNAILARDEAEEDAKPLTESLTESRRATPSPAPSQFSSQPPGPPSPSFSSPVHPLPSAPVPRPFLPPLLPHHLHPLLYQHSNIPRTGFTLPGSATTLFPLPGTFPWSAGFRGQYKPERLERTLFGTNWYRRLLNCLESLSRFIDTCGSQE